jgi:competence protein ComEC
MALAEIQGCDGADILISNQSNEVQRPCEVFDIERLRETGALGLSLTEFGGLKVTAEQTITGNCPWSAQSDGDPVALSFILHANNRQFANVDQ